MKPVYPIRLVGCMGLGCGLWLATMLCAQESPVVRRAEPPIQLPRELFLQISNRAQQSQSWVCGVSLQSLESSVRLWTVLESRGVYPKHLLELRDELGRPSSLVCPADTNHSAAQDWAHAGPTNISYQLLLAGQRAGDPATTNTLLRCPVHGHTVLEDGTIVRGRPIPPRVDWEEVAKTYAATLRLTPQERARLQAAQEMLFVQKACDMFLRQLMTAVEIHMDDDNGIIPQDLKVLSQELGAPFLLRCPADEDKERCVSWNDFDPAKNLSYQVLEAGKKLASLSTNQPVFFCPVHGRAISRDNAIRDHGTPRRGSGKSPEPI